MKYNFCILNLDVQLKRGYSVENISGVYILHFTFYIWLKGLRGKQNENC